jgi:hypothetical protein
VQKDNGVLVRYGGNLERRGKTFSNGGGGEGIQD